MSANEREWWACMPPRGPLHFTTVHKTWDGTTPKQPSTLDGHAEARAVVGTGDGPASGRRRVVAALQPRHHAPIHWRAR